MECHFKSPVFINILKENYKISTRRVGNDISVVPKEWFLDAARGEVHRTKSHTKDFRVPPSSPTLRGLASRPLGAFVPENNRSRRLVGCRSLGDRSSVTLQILIDLVSNLVK